MACYISVTLFIRLRPYIKPFGFIQVTTVSYCLRCFDPFWIQPTLMGCSKNSIRINLIFDRVELDRLCLINGVVFGFAIRVERLMWAFFIFHHLMDGVSNSASSYRKFAFDGLIRPLCYDTSLGSHVECSFYTAWRLFEYIQVIISISIYSDFA